MSCTRCCFTLDWLHRPGLFKRFSTRRKNRTIVLMLVGLDNAGKSSAAKGLAHEPVSSVVPTVGFNSVKLKHRGFSVIIYDLGGSPQIRGIWHEYYGDVHGMIFVVDASDLSRIDESHKALEQMLTHEKLAGKPLLLLANKQDKDGALDDLDIVEKLNLEVLVNQQKCPTMVQTCSAAGNSKLDPGILSGYRWLLRRIISEYESINSRVEQDCAEQRAAMELARQQWRNKLSQEDLHIEANGNPFKPIQCIVEREQNGQVCLGREVESNIVHVEADSPDSSSHTIGEAEKYIPLHSPSPVTKSHLVLNNQSDHLDLVVAVKEQFERKMHKQKQHKLKMLRNNRTAPASANFSMGDKVLPPLKGLPSNPCPWARPSTAKSLPPEGWGLNHPLELVLQCEPSESQTTLVVLKSPRTVDSTDSDQDDVVCGTHPDINHCET